MNAYRMETRRSRRDFMKEMSMGLAALAALPEWGEAQAAAPGGRPNILFCLADDWMWPHASIAGDAVVKTPAFDRVAREGVMFTNAFVAAPSCTPSRAAMLTGQWPWRLGEGVNLHGTLPAQFPVYPDLLEAAGYHVGLTRKGWGPGNFTVGGRTRNPAGPQYKDFEAFMAVRPKDAPFCFWFGSTEPHRQYVWESGVASGMDIKDVKVPPYLPDTETVRKDICDYYAEVQTFNRDVSGLLESLERQGLLDDTIVVMSGDNGWPFPRSKATLYESGTHVPLAIRWPRRIKPGRVVEDFVSLSDLAPTFLEAAGLTPPGEMTGRSLMPILASGQAGRVDPARDHVLTGMERHTPSRRIAGQEVGAGYPMRALRTHEFHYIRNFKPERWAAGDPNGFETPGVQPFTYEQLAKETRLTFADVDSGPTKAWMLTHRDDEAVRPLYARTFGKRPERELYDLKKDPFQLNNVAEDPAYAQVLKKLDAQLMAALKASNDPRASGGGAEFDAYPIRDATEAAPGKGKKGNKQRKGKKKGNSQ